MAAYLIARINVTDPEDYKAYASQTVALAEEFGGRFPPMAERRLRSRGSARTAM